ncbi:protein kinase C delta type-like [Rhinoderma darwinii]|uniref:protein kinase C delta type-like n=1 Tax=Rhinoderma darwinii TaxID=43563 RepID=UPI003F678DB9
MELATRGDLHAFILKNFPLDTAIIQFISAEVVCGTEFLHNKGILHRDLKMENILLTTDGHVKITDFGLAVTGVFKKTTETCKGTPGYAAPEMVKDQAHGRGVDFFAIGVILYQLFTGETAFPGKHPREIERSVLYHAPPYPKYLTPDTVNILEGLLCKDQFQRLGVKGDFKKHPFFSSINWENVDARRMAPPASLMAVSVDLNFNQTLEYTEMPNRIRTKDQKIFNNFSFVCPEWSKHYHPVITQTRTRMAKPFTKRSFRKNKK